MRPDRRNSVQTNEFGRVLPHWYHQCHHQSGVSGTVLVAFGGALPPCLSVSSLPISIYTMSRRCSFMKKYSLWFSLQPGFHFFHLMKHSACFICRHNYLIVCLSLFCLFLSFFLFFQKPKPKDWHPPGGFILGLWALIIMVFFKTYGIKHMKHIFWIWASRMIALTATLDSLVSSELSLCVLWL